MHIMGVLTNITSEYFGVSVREDEGRSFNIDGKKYIIKFEDFIFIKNLIPIDGDNYFIKKEFDFFDEPIYMCCAFESGKYGDSYDYHYILNCDLQKVKNNIIEDGIELLINSDYDIFSDNLLVIRILEEAMSEISDLDNCLDLTCETIINKYDGYYEIDNQRKVLIYSNKDVATKDAIEKEEDYLIGEFSDSMSREDVERYKKNCGSDWIDDDEIKDSLEESWKGDCEEKKYNKGEHGCELFDDMISNRVISDNTNYFDIDKDKPKFDIDDYREKLIECIMDDEEISREEAVKEINGFKMYEYSSALIDFNLVDEDEEYFEIDYDSPNFDVDEKIEELVEKLLDNITDFEEYYISNFGYLPRDFCDYRKLAEKVIESDGAGSQLSSWDGEEHRVTIDKVDYFLYVN